MICATAYLSYTYVFDNISRAMTLQEPIAISCVIRCPTIQNELRYFQHLSQLQIQDDKSLKCELPRLDAAKNTIKLTAHVPIFCFSYIEDGGGLLANLREIPKSVYHLSPRRVSGHDGPQAGGSTLSWKHNSKTV
jgi:hypothetical protein